jgi:hypothetical protein
VLICTRPLRTSTVVVEIETCLASVSRTVAPAAPTSLPRRLRWVIRTTPDTGSMFIVRPARGAGSAQTTWAVAFGSAASGVWLPSLSTYATSTSGPSRTPSQVIRATPLPSVWTAPALSFGPAIS